MSTPRKPEKTAAATKVGDAERDTYILDNIRTVLSYAGLSHDTGVRVSNIIEFLRELPK